MIKIDIVSLTGLTAVDGSVVAEGAIVRFETTFFNGVSEAKIKIQVFRNRELFESGYENVRVLELPYEFNLKIPDDIYYTMTPEILYGLIKDELNNIIGGECFEVSITTN